jgi:hypothetical protein
MSKASKRAAKASRKHKQSEKAKGGGNLPAEQPPASLSNSDPHRFRFNKFDPIGALAIPLAVAALMIENSVVVGVCLALCAGIACAPAITHYEISKKYRVIYCTLVLAICAVLFFNIKAEN